MSKQNSQVTTLALPAGGEDSSGTSNLIKKYIYHWPLFVSCVLLALIPAYFYLKTTNHF